MGCISDLAPDSQALELWRQDIEHSHTGDEGGCTQGNWEFIRRAIVISDDLMFASRDLRRVKGGDLWRREVVQRSVDVPSVETGVTFGSILWGNLGLVETGVLRVLQLGFVKTFVIVNGTVPDELNLRDPRDRLEVGVEDRFGAFFGFVVAVTVGVALGIECLAEEDVIIYNAHQRDFSIFIRRTFVSLYCSSGERSTFLKRSTLCCTSG